MSEAWRSGDKFEVRVEDKPYLFDFGVTKSGVFIAVHDGLKITLEGANLAECREVACEAIELILEDMRDEGESVAGSPVLRQAWTEAGWRE